MSIREKIIVICAFLMVIYGAVEFWGLPHIFLFKSQKSVEKPIKTTEDLAFYIKNVANNLVKHSISEAEYYMLQQTPKKWTSNPFKDPLPPKKVRKIKKIMPRYSGYIFMGKRKIAVLDGLEYEIGKEIKPEGYYKLLEIWPRYVIISGSKQENIKIPIIESVETQK